MRATKVASIAAGVLAVAFVVYWTVSYFQFRGRVNETLAMLSGLIERGRLDQAAAELERLKTDDPDVVNSTDVVEQAETLGDLIRKDASRRKNFEAKLLAGAATNGTDGDSNVLGEARKLAANDDERERVDIAIKVAQQAQAKSLGRRQREFATRVDAFADRVENIKAGRAAEEALSDAGLAQLVRDAETLADDAGSLGDALKTRAGGVRDSARLAVEHRRVVRRQLERKATFAAAGGDTLRFRELLAAFADEFPDSPSGKDMRRASPEFVYWEGFQQWARLMSQPELLDFVALPPSTAARILQEGQVLAKQYEKAPLAEEFARLEPMLKATAARQTADKKPLETGLVKLFKDKLMQNVYMVESKDGKRYYGPKAAASAEGTTVTRFNYYTGFDFSERPKVFDNNKIAAQGLAPQHKLATEGLRILGTVTPANWEKPILEVARLVEGAKDIDPVLKMFLLQQVVATARAGGPTLQAALAEYHTALDEAAVDVSAPWMDPADDTANAAREAAKEATEKLPPLPLVGALDGGIEQWTLPAGSRCRWLGWLGRDARSDWRCWFRDAQEASGDVFVIVPPEGGRQNAALVMIGQAQRGVTSLQSGKSELSSAFVEGRPVFVSSEPPATKTPPKASSSAAADKKVPAKSPQRKANASP